jgi:hypothetical protein
VRPRPASRGRWDGQFETRGRVVDDKPAVAEVRGRARGGRHAHVGGQAEQHDLRDDEAPQAQVEVGADERGVAGFIGIDDVATVPVFRVTLERR